jgi:hypothetical protein
MGVTVEVDDTTEDTAPEKRKSSRKIELTPDMFEKAGMAALSWRHIAGIVGVDMKTVANRMKEPEFREAFERGKMKSQTAVMQHLFKHMQNGSIKATIFLAQAWCHLTTKHEVKHDGEVTTKYVVEVPPDAPSLDAWSQVYAPSAAADNTDGTRLN